MGIFKGQMLLRCLQIAELAIERSWRRICSEICELDGLDLIEFGKISKLFYNPLNYSGFRDSYTCHCLVPTVLPLRPELACIHRLPINRGLWWPRELYSFYSQKYGGTRLAYDGKR